METALLKSLVIVYSYHHHNTEKVAHAMADVLHAEVKHPQDINSEDIQHFDLVGFGAGIDSGKHYEPILNLASELPIVKGKKAFIFSTSAMVGEKKIDSDHLALRKILISKGYKIINEFHCKGFNTNSFLKFVGGMNKGRPNAEDLKEAKAFAQKLVQLPNKTCDH
ncbi:MAG: flavodoxin family protein [Candidatus Marinimicrobia bacterium]|nr:flavodoxin family protein [Candidatus Neomarinimicrobiota bacterium]